MLLRIPVFIVLFLLELGTDASRLEDAIPGTPGRDYPIMSSIPRTQFSCSGRLPGYYGDTEARCQVFHICHDSRQSSFLCPNGTLFNQRFFVCDWWFNVDCSKAPALYALNENFFRSAGQTSPPVSANERIFQQQTTPFSSVSHSTFHSSLPSSNTSPSHQPWTTNFFPTSAKSTAQTTWFQSAFSQQQSSPQRNFIASTPPPLPSTTPSWLSRASTPADEFDFTFLSPTPPPSFVEWKKEAPAFFQQPSKTPDLTSSTYFSPLQDTSQTTRLTPTSSVWTFQPTWTQNKAWEPTTAWQKPKASPPERLVSTTVRALPTTTKKLLDSTSQLPTPDSWVLLSQEPNMIANILTSSKVYLLQRQNSTTGLVETTTIPVRNIPTTTTFRPPTTNPPTLPTLSEVPTTKVPLVVPENQVVFTNSNIEVLNINVLPVTEREIITAAPEGSNVTTSSPSFVQFSAGKPKTAFKASPLISSQAPKTTFQPVAPNTQLPPTVPVTSPAVLKTYSPTVSALAPQVHHPTTTTQGFAPVRPYTAPLTPVHATYFAPQVATTLPRPAVVAQPSHNVQLPVQGYQTNIPRPTLPYGSPQVNPGLAAWNVGQQAQVQPRPTVQSYAPNNPAPVQLRPTVQSYRPNNLAPIQLRPTVQSYAQQKPLPAQPRPAALPYAPYSPAPAQIAIPPSPTPQVYFNVMQHIYPAPAVPYSGVQQPQQVYQAQLPARPAAAQYPQAPQPQPVQQASGFRPPQAMPLTRSAIPFRPSQLINTTPSANPLQWYPKPPGQVRSARAPHAQQVVYGTQVSGPARPVPALYPRAFRVRRFVNTR